MQDFYFFLLKVKVFETIILMDALIDLQPQVEHIIDMQITCIVSHPINHEKSYIDIHNKRFKFKLNLIFPNYRNVLSTTQFPCGILVAGQASILVIFLTWECLHCCVLRLEIIFTFVYLQDCSNKISPTN